MRRSSEHTTASSLSAEELHVFFSSTAGSEGLLLLLLLLLGCVSCGTPSSAPESPSPSVVSDTLLLTVSEISPSILIVAVGSETFLLVLPESSSSTLGPPSKGESRSLASCVVVCT